MTRLLTCTTMAALLSVSLAADAHPARRLWVWNAAPLLGDAGERQAFIEFCKGHRIGVVAMQVITRVSGGVRRLDRAPEWQVLLEEMHRRGIKLHALDGAPQYARASEHNTVLSIVDAVIAHNASAAAVERFDGIHFDIEPYLLEEWADPRAREPLLAEYLDLNERAARRSRAAGLEYGVDVPFWWPSIDETTGEAISITTFRGVRKAAIDHLLEIVDTVGIMAYRNVAAGPDGIIAHALATIERAGRTARARTFVGVETENVSEGVPAKVTFAGKSIAELSAQVEATEAALAGYPSYAGIAFHRYRTFRDLVLGSR